MNKRPYLVSLIWLIKSTIFCKIHTGIIAMGKRRTIFDCFNFFLLAAVCAEVVAVVEPPSIFFQPQQDVYFTSGETLELPCFANGNPSPRCKWYRNGVEIDMIRNIDHFTHDAFQNCSLVINNMQRQDEGIYQCKASNSYGESLSVKVNLREAVMNKFIPGPVQYHYPHLGTSLRLPCNPPQSVPMAEYHWLVVDNNMTTTTLNMTNGRISMDYSGNLYFANIQKEDGMDGNSYVCMVINDFLRKSVTGNEHKIRPQGSIELSSPPSYLWTSPSNSLGLRKEVLRLKCIFSGNPTPIVIWTTPDTANSSKTISGQEIEIFEPDEKDEGQYICSGRSTMHSPVSRNIDIHIESKPYFIIEPKNVEITKGQTSFLCKAGGKPIPDVQWYINGVKIQDSQHPTILSERFLRPDQNNITFVDLRKEDTMCIQCNASNKHGYVFTDVFLNVVNSPVN